MVFFEKKSVGLDIADHTIEVVELGRDKKIHGMGRVSLAAGIVERGKIKDAEKLSEAVKKLLGKTSITTKKIVFGLPESQVYTVFLSAEDDIAKHVPLKKDNIVYSAPVACSKEVLKEWQQFFKKLGIDVIFDAEPLAIIRGLFPKLPKEPVCIVDLGFATTAVMIVDNKGLRHSFSMKTAGNTLTKEIAKTLNISEENAEERKKQVGLSEPNARIFAPLTKVLGSIVAELQTSLEYFKVKEVVLVGGSSELKGLRDYFKTNLAKPVRLGKSSLAQKRLYIAAAGMAQHREGKDPVLEISQERKRTEKKPKKDTETVKSEKIDVTDQIAISRLRKQKIMLAFIVGVGIVAVAGAFLFRSQEKTAQEQELQSETAQYTKTQSFELQVPVAVSESEYTPDRVTGHIVENIIEASGSYEEALPNSKRKVEKEIKEGEILWQNPISSEQTEFPMTFQWLLYTEKEANELLLKEVEKLNTENIEFALNNIEKTEITKTDNPNIYYVFGTVTLSLNELISNSVATPAPLEAVSTEVPISTVLVLDTPTGLLNVREGPGIQFEAFTEVKPGENYELLKEQDNWYNIKIPANTAGRDEETAGWVYSTYAEKQ